MYLHSPVSVVLLLFSVSVFSANLLFFCLDFIFCAVLLEDTETGGLVMPDFMIAED